MKLINRQVTKKELLEKILEMSKTTRTLRKEKKLLELEVIKLQKELADCKEELDQSNRMAGGY